MVIDGALDLSATFVVHIDARVASNLEDNRLESESAALADHGKGNDKGGAQVQGAVKDHVKVKVDVKLNGNVLKGLGFC